jgi:hypothetical protein
MTALTALPPAFAAATLVPLPDRDGYLALMPIESAVTCPRCAENGEARALGLAVLRQDLATGRWQYRCIVCDGAAVAA